MKLSKVVLAFKDGDRIIFHKLYKTSELAQFNLANVVGADVSWEMNQAEFREWFAEFEKTAEEKS